MTQSKDIKSYLVKFAGTLIGVLVLILLVGYIYFFEIRKENEKTKKENIFPSIKEEQVGGIILNYPSNMVICRKDGKSWFVLKDLKRFKADSKIIKSMIESFNKIRIEKVVSENQADLSGFGLEKPQAQVIAETPEKKYRILIGGESPVGTGTYIRLDNDSRILLVSRSSILEFLRKSANDLRDKQVLSLNEDNIKRLQFKWKDSSFEVERKNGDWIGKNIPEYIDIDGGRVWAILRTFLNLKIDNFEDDEPKNLGAYGLDKPSAEIELFEDGKPICVLFGNKKENGDYFVKLTSNDSVYSVSEFVLRQIPENVNDIRARRIVKLDTEKVSRVEINRSDNKISILKKGNKWELEGEKNKEVDESKVGYLLADITSLEVEGFVADNPRDLSSYGLDKPEIELTIVEANKRKTLLFGKKQNKRVYAKLADKNSIYMLGDDILAKLPSSNDELIKK